MITPEELDTFILANVAAKVARGETKAPETPTSGEADALRFSTGKLRYDLIPPEWIDGLAHVLTANLMKYPERNFEKGMSYQDCYRAILSHAIEWEFGKDTDVDPARKGNNYHHMLAVAWNALAIVMCQQRGIGKDDRPVPNYTGVYEKQEEKEDDMPF